MRTYKANKEEKQWIEITQEMNLGPETHKEEFLSYNTLCSDSVPNKHCLITVIRQDFDFSTASPKLKYFSR